MALESARVRITLLLNLGEFLIFSNLGFFIGKWGSWKYCLGPRGSEQDRGQCRALFSSAATLTRPEGDKG